MRHLPIAALAITLTLGVPGCEPADGGTAEPAAGETGAPQGSSEPSAADLQAIRSLDAAATEAGVAGDFDAFAALYTEDAVLLPPNAPAVRGRSAIREYWSSVPPITAFDIDIEEIVGRGDLAYVLGSYALELSPPGAPGPIRDEGKFIEIRRRQPDGSWPLARDIYNSDLPAAGVGTAEGAGGSEG